MPEILQAGSIRAGALDRTVVADRLIAHFQDGRLPRSELDARLARAAAASSDDELHLLTIDLPDVPRVSGPLTVPRGRPATIAAGPSPLRIAFDVMVMLLTFAAGVCLVLLLIMTAASSAHSSGTFVVAGLATLGAFTVGAGGVHLLHRAFGKR